MRKPLGLAAFLIPAAALVSPAHAIDYLTPAQAQTLLFPAAKAFVDRSLTFSTKQREHIKELSGVGPRTGEQSVWRAERDGQLLGWFMVDEVVGKHEFITYAAALSPEGKVLGIEILSYRESHGGQIRNAAWRQRFAGKTVADVPTLDDDIPNISGATLSCHHLIDGMKRLLVVHTLFLAHG